MKKHLHFCKRHNNYTIQYLLSFFLLFLFLFSPFNTLKAQNCTVNAGVDYTICANQTMTLYGVSNGLYTGSGDITWKQVSGPSVTIVSPHSLTTNVTGFSAGIYGFTLNAKCSDGSLISDLVTVTVKPISIANAGSPQTVCPGTNVGTLAANAPAAGETGLWTVVAGSGISVTSTNSPTSTFSASATGSATSTLRWTITGAAGSPQCSTYSDVVITNRGGVTSVSAGPNQTLGDCFSTNTSTSLAASFGGNNIDGQVGTWTVISGPNIPTLGDSHSNTSTLSNLIQGTYVLRWTVSGPCGIAGTSDVNIIVPAPTQDVTGASAPSMSFCDGRTSFVLTGNNPLYAGETVLWTGPAGFTISSPTSAITSVYYTGGGSPTGTQVFTYTITNSATGCTSSANVNVTFNTAPSITLSSGTNLLLDCSETTAAIHYTESGSGQIQWRIISGPTNTSYPSMPTAWVDVTGGGIQNIPNLDKLGTYVIRFQKTPGVGSTCSTVSADINVVTSFPPTSSNAGTDQLLGCNVVSTALAANSPSVGTGHWSQISGPNTAIIADPASNVSPISGLIPGTYKFRWVITGGPKCSTTQGDATVTVSNATPTASNAGTGVTICYGTPYTLQANTPILNETGTWTWTKTLGTGTLTFSDIHNPHAIITGTEINSTYQLTWTIVNGCGSTTSNVIISTSPTQGPIQSHAGPDQCLPSGTTGFLLNGNDPSPGTGLWTKLTGGAASITNPAQRNSTVTGMTDGTYTFEWAITYNDCVVTRDTMMVTISAPATTATISGGTYQAVCGNSTSLTGSTAVVGTGLWTQTSGNAGPIITTPTAATTTITGLTDGVYVFRWTISNNACSSSYAEVTLNASTPPSAAVAGGDVVLCGSTSTVLNANVPSVGTGLWSIIDGPSTPAFSSYTAPNATISGLVTGVYHLKWTVSNGPNCTPNSSTMSITVTETAYAGADQTLCDVTTANLTGNITSTGIWTQVGTLPNVATITSTGNSSATVSGLIVGTYTFRYTITSGSCSTYSDTHVTISGQPSIANAGLDQQHCNASSFTLTGNTPVNGTGTWSQLSGPAGTFNDIHAPGAVFTPTTANAPGLYMFAWTISQGGCSNADQVRITNYAPPSVSVAGSDQDVCGTTATMAANTPTSGNGLWALVSKPTGAADPVITSVILPNTTITGLNTEGDYKFSWTISTGYSGGEAGCIPNTSNVTLHAHNQPTTAIAGSPQTLCAATTATLAGNTITTGTGLWTKDSGPAAIIDSPTSPTSTLSGLSPGVYVFRWTSTLPWSGGGGSCTSSSTVTITNDAAPTTSVAGAPITVCLFSPITLAANTPIVGVGTWTQTAGPSTASFSDIHSPTATVLGVVVGSYTFQWTISNGSCSSSVSTVNLTVNDLPTVAVAGKNQTLCNNTTATMAGNTPSSGTGTWTGTYGTITDPTNRLTTITGINTPGTYTYTWTISTGSSGCSSSDVMTVTKNQDVVVTAPSPITICNGGTPTLTVSATGGTGTHTYQWYSSPDNTTWTLISGATDPSYTTLPLSSNTYYYCQVDCVNSTSALVTVVPDPAIITQPTGTTICQLDETTLVIAGRTGTGTPSLNYQWQSSPDGTSSWTNVGTGGDTYHASLIRTTTYYRVLVSATGYGCNTIISNIAPVYVSHISVQPQAITQICDGGTVALSVAATSDGGTAAYTYQWQSATSYYGTYTNIGGATSATYSPTLTTGDYFYQCVITSTTPSCTLTSDVAEVLAVADPTIPVVPDQSICKDGHAIFAVAPSGGISGTYLYQWQSAPTLGGSYTNIIGATSASYTTPTMGTPGNYYYQCVVNQTTSGCSSTSNEITLTVVPDPAITSQPVSYTICSGSTQTLNVTASGGTPSLNYQWQSSPTGLTGTWNNVVGGSGANTNSYTTPVLTQTTYYHVIITASGNDCNTVTSNAVVVSVPRILTQPVPSTICTGGTQLLSVTADAGSATLGYQWQVSTLDCTTSGSFIDIPGATSSTYITPVLTATRYYRCNITITSPSCSTLQTDCAAVNVIPDPTISNQPTGTTICSGSTHTMSVVLSGGTGTYGYQWQQSTTSATGPWVNAVGGSGATTNTYTTPALTQTTYYQVIVTQTGSGCDFASTTNAATVTVNLAATANTGIASTTICETSSYTFTTATATNYASLSWSTTGTGSFNDQTALNPTYSPSAADIASGSVTLRLTATGNSPCSNPTSTTTLNISRAPTAYTGPNATICASSLSYSLSSSTATHYTAITWTTGGTGTFNDIHALHPVYTPSTADITAGNVTLTLTSTATAPCTTAISNMILTINATPVSNAGSTLNLCNQTSVTLAANNPSPSTGVWTLISGPNVPAFANASFYNTSVTGLIPGIYIFRWTVSNGVCTNATSQVTINNYGTPTTANAGEAQTSCGLTTSVVMAANTPIVGSGAWTQTAGAAATITTLSSPTTTITGLSIGSYTFRWTISNGSCTTSYSEVNVTIQNCPPVAGISSVADQPNPGGTNSVSVPSTQFSGTDPDGTIASIKITTIPTNVTSITINGTPYTTNASLGTGIIVPTNTSGNPTQTISIDPIDGSVTSVISYYVIDNLGLISSSPGTVSLPFTNVTITGTVFDDANGLTNNTVDGTGTNASSVYMNLVNAAHTVVASKAVAADGTYTFTTADGVLPSTNYTVILTNGSKTIGSTLTAATYPANWVSTGENIGTGLGNDGLPDGILSLNTNSGNVSNADFGIEQLPSATSSTATSQVNPGGTNNITVGGFQFAGSDIDGTVSNIKITVFPTNVTSITINGTTYTSGTFPGGGVTVPVNTLGNPLVPITIDPIDGAVTPVITYVEIDNAGKASSSATVTLPLTDLAITGTVTDDNNGLTDNIVNGTVTNVSNSLYVNLVNSSNKVVSSVAVASDGTYSFTTANGATTNTNYNLILTNGSQTAGTTLSSATYPSNWVSTGENIGTGIGNDGSVNGILAVNTNSGNVANADFGLEQKPTATTSVLPSQVNPGGTNMITVSSASFTGTDTDGTVTQIHYTTFPFGITSITIGGTNYTSSSWPSGGVTVATSTVITVDPVSGAGNVVIPFKVIDNAGVESSNQATVTLPVTDIIISGTVFDDNNGLTDNTVNGTGTNIEGSAFVNLVRASDNKVVASVSVASDGSYSFTTGDGVSASTGYNIILTSALQTTGATLTTAILPANWVSTGEHIGTGVGNDGSINSILTVNTTGGDVTNANFGIEQRPTSTTTTLASQQNPGGTNMLSISPGSFTGTDADGTVTQIHYTTFPTGVTSITIGGTSYTSSTWPVDGVTVNTGTSVSVDPLNGAGSVLIPFKVIDNAGVESSNESTVTLPVIDLTISGSLYNDANGQLGLPVNTVDGTLTNVSGTVYANLVNGAGTVVASVGVAGDGTYTFGTSDGVTGSTAYTLVLTNALQTSGTTLTTSTLPTGWVSTGEHLGTGAGNDGTADGKLSVTTNSGSVTGANFGIEQLPTAVSATAATQTNPGGTTNVTVPSSLFSGTDPTPGNISSIRITTFPTNVTTITIGGTSYTSGTFPVGGVSVPANTNGNPTVAIQIDPVDGSVTPVISYVVIDNAGKESTNTATVALPFGALTITGIVYNDINGLTDNTVNGNGTNIVNTLYMNLVDASNKVVSSVAVGAGGTYSFSDANGVTAGTSYNLILTNAVQTSGVTLSTSVLPTGWVSTGENIGSGVGNEGTINGILTVNTTSGSISNANFGIEQLPTATSSTVSSQANPGNGNMLSIAPGAFTGTDPDAGTITQIHYTGFPTGVASVTIGGTNYTLGTWPSAGVTVSAGTTLSVDPVDGTGNVVISFKTIDNAGKESSNIATVTLPIIDLTITGMVFHDGDGGSMGGTGVGTAGTSQLYANLVNTSTGKVVGEVAVNSDGTYSLGTSNGVKDNTGYTVVLSTTQGQTGGTISALLLDGWINTAEGLTSAGDGTPNGILSVNIVTKAITNANFGIEQKPVATSATLPSQINPGGTNMLTIAPGSFAGTDADGTVAQIHYTTFPTGVTSITIGGTNYTSSTWPSGGVTVNTGTSVSVDPLDGVGSVVIPFKVIDNAGIESNNEATVTLPMVTLTISGSVYNDVNGLLGLPVNTVDGTPTNVSGTVFANLTDATNNIVASVGVAGDGTYTFGTSDGVTGNTVYTLILTNALQISGTTLTTSTLPTGWISTGEHLGAGAGNDGTADGKLSVTTNSGSVTNANFGIEQLPTAVSATAATQTNPGGTTNVTVPSSLFSGTDPTPGNISSIRITTFPTNVTSITIGGTSYTSGTFPSGGVTVPANTNGNPTVAIQIDPVDGSVTPVISYVVIDNSGKESANIATVTMPFSNISLSGIIYEDTNGLRDNTVNGNGTNAGGNVYINLMDAGNKVVTSVAVASDGTYMFNSMSGLKASTSYNLILSNTLQSAGTILTAASYPSNWFATGENIGTSVGNDGIVNGILSINMNTENISNANFGIAQNPVAINDSVTIPEDNISEGNLIGNDTDTEGNTLTITGFSIGGKTYQVGTTTIIPGVGTIIINSNGDYSFNPDLHYSGNVPAITYFIKDGIGGISQAILSIKVLPFSYTPVIFNEKVLTCSSSPVSGNILSNGDNDPNGGILTVGTTLVSQPLHGNFKIQSNGDYVYTPNSNYGGIDKVIVSECNSGNPSPVKCANDTVFITVVPAVIVKAGSDTTICEISPFKLIGASAQNYSSLEWTTNGTGYFSDFKELNPTYTPSPADVIAGKVVLNLMAKSILPCADASSSLTLTINPKASIDVTACCCDNKTCYMTPFTVNGVIAKGYSKILWTSDGKGTIAGATTLTPTYIPAAGESGLVNLTITVQGCSTATAKIALTVQPQIIVDAGPNQSIPYNTTTNLVGVASGGSGSFSYSWKPFSMVQTSNTDKPTTVKMLNDQMFVLTVTDVVTGCYAKDSVKVTIGSKNHPPVAVDDYDTTAVNTQIPINVLLNDYDPDGNKLTMSQVTDPQHGRILYTRDSTFVYMPDVDFTGNDKFTYSICDNGIPSLCDTATVYIHIQKDLPLIIHNVITPNGDGQNDKWIIDGIEKFPDNTIVILNRWGDHVRTFNRYDNKNQVWDGTNNMGRPLPDGTYYYVLTIKGFGAKSGWIFVRGNFSH